MDAGRDLRQSRLLRGRVTRNRADRGHLSGHCRALGAEVLRTKARWRRSADTASAPARDSQSGADHNIVPL